MRLLFSSTIAFALVVVALCIGTVVPKIPDTGSGSDIVAVDSPFSYIFKTSGTLHETGRMRESTSPYWWLNSGGKLIIENGIGKTMQSDAALSDRWLRAYKTANAADSDQGLHPQNLFRLVSRSLWGNVREEMNFKIIKNNFSTSPNRNSSNGLLLMSRYAIDGQSLYYAGVRVDGTAVIKKKYNGTYYTMAQKKIFPGTYVAGGSMNLLPHGEWLSLRSETLNNSDGSVSLRLSMRHAGENEWTELIETKDSGQYGNTAPITKAGHIGVRTDFMDVQFDDFRAERVAF